MGSLQTGAFILKLCRKSKRAMRYEVRTSQKLEDVKKEAFSFFGEGGLGLTLTQEHPFAVTFSGGGGHVAISLQSTEKTTVIHLETREWDTQVQEFMRRISKKRWWK
jgi:hypothetical protein